MERSRMLTRWASTATAVAVLSACGGTRPSSLPIVRAIVDATDGADTARVNTLIRVTYPGDTGFSYAFEMSGVIDFTNRRGLETTRQLPSPSTTTTPGSPNGDGLTLSAGSSVTESRWIGDDAYSKGMGMGTSFGSSSRPWMLVDNARVRSASPCLASVDVAASNMASGAAASPSEILDSLRRAGKWLERVGTETIRGVSTTHWKVATFGMPVSSCHRTTAATRSINTSMDVWTDSANRARRIRIVATGPVTTPIRVTDPKVEGATTTTQPSTQMQTTEMTTEFFDFGAPVEVHAPPADQVIDLTDFWIAMSLGYGAVDAHDWHDVAHGVIGGTPWAIYAARTTTGWHCYDTTDTPQNDVAALESNASPEHNGHVTDCEVAGMPFVGVFNAFINSTDGNRRVIVGVVPGGGNAQLKFGDGSSQHLEIDQDIWIASWSGPITPAPVRIDVDGTACRIDGQGADGYDLTAGLEAITNAARAGNIACGGVTPETSLLPEPIALGPNGENLGPDGKPLIGLDGKPISIKSLGDISSHP
jgi:hypothetical protein